MAAAAVTKLAAMTQYHKLSEYHSGYRGFTCQVLKDPPLTHNLDDFLFDNEMLSQAILPRLSHQ